MVHIKSNKETRETKREERRKESEKKRRIPYLLLLRRFLRENRTQQTNQFISMAGFIIESKEQPRQSI